MVTKSAYQKNITVYPGEYTPLYKFEDLVQKGRYPRNGHHSAIPVKIEVIEDGYAAVLEIPGMTKETIHLEVDNSRLYVYLIRNCRPSTEDMPVKAYTPDFGIYYFQEIHLPKDADPIFLRAEYVSGILKLFIPRSARPLTRHNATIAIY